MLTSNTAQLWLIRLSPWRSIVGALLILSSGLVAAQTVSQVPLSVAGGVPGWAIHTERRAVHAIAAVSAPAKASPEHHGAP